MDDAFQRLQSALVDRYQIERELGRGGMATVYLARDLKHDRLVAIKVLRPELAAALGPERFLREIQFAARLQHPHVLGLYDSGDTGGMRWYAMPYVPGESLRDRMEREQQPPVDDAIQITQQVAAALNYAHAQGIIHRDIKPENILLANGHALVADFGIAKAVDAARGEKLTETGLAIGTPSYMSPEQSLGEAVDGRSDLYALGCVLYEILAGEPPYTGPTAQAIIAKRLSEPLPSLRVVRETARHAPYVRGEALVVHELQRAELIRDEAYTCAPAQHRRVRHAALAPVPIASIAGAPGIRSAEYARPWREGRHQRVACGMFRTHLPAAA